MAFDFATVENTVQKQQVKAASLATPAPEAGWAAENPDRGLAYLFVAQADNGMIAEILAA